MGHALDLGRVLVREPDELNARAFRRRVTWLAAIHPMLFLVAVAGLTILIWHGRYFVTLSQRSNVETLTIAFFLMFFTYVAMLTGKGALGGLRVAWYRLHRDGQLRALGAVGAGPSAALNCIVERSDRPGEPFRLQICDRRGSMGALKVDGVRVLHTDAFLEGSNSLLAYFVRQLIEVGKLQEQHLDIVHWSSTENEELLKFAALAAALRETWPRVVLSPDQCAQLEQRLSAICPALRDEALLPHWEFEGEHKVPIIPEPLGIISFSRHERRVDPLSSLTAALLVVILAVGLIVFFIVRPPWVPGA